MKKAKKNKRPLTKTENQFKAYRGGHIALKVAPYATASIPFGTELLVNWSKWFPEGQNNTSVGIGLAMAVMTTLLSVLAISKKDSEFMKKVGPFITVAIGFVAWGAVCIFLANVLVELGKLLIFAGCGILGAAVEDIVDSSVILPKYNYLKQLADENGLTKKGEWEAKTKQQAIEDGKEKLRYIPYD